MKVDKTKVYQINKSTILNMIRLEGPISKTELSKRIGLSIPTIMKITSDFLNSGLIRVLGKANSTGGKPAELLEFIPNSHYLIGINIGRHNLNGVIMDLSANIIAKESCKTGDVLPESLLVEKVISLVNSLINKSKIKQEAFLGMGVAMPGILENGKVLFSPDFSWENYDLLSELSNYFDWLNISIDNSNRLLALGEHWFGSGVGATSLFCVNLGYGIGSAIIENGIIVKGSSGTAGEFGHYVLEKNGELCSCGNRGCLESVASGNAIARTAQEKVKNGEITTINNAVNDVTDIEAKVVFDEMRKGDKVATDIVKYAVEGIGIALSSCINLLDPEYIILSGGLVKSNDLYLPYLKEVVRKNQMPYAGRKLEIRIGSLGDYGASVGAATLVLKKFIENGGKIDPIA
ncbi:ROK family transcriptional regulator [Neobacillus cucumis]|uniref:ROK family transcriptional regulator n=1 Tax=Neobacillus cucumis TaxID=1740721 RepID=UPI002853112B|nr:ROK family transcriptional regulator [Neobacillus cucumis]MDR4949591.1 ROK family transcriptional regulator [Neobacillus cucumis]